MIGEHGDDVYVRKKGLVLDFIIAAKSASFTIK